MDDIKSLTELRTRIDTAKKPSLDLMTKRRTRKVAELLEGKERAERRKRDKEAGSI